MSVVSTEHPPEGTRVQHLLVEVLVSWLAEGDVVLEGGVLNPRLLSYVRHTTLEGQGTVVAGEARQEYSRRG